MDRFLQRAIPIPQVDAHSVAATLRDCQVGISVIVKVTVNDEDRTGWRCVIGGALERAVPVTKEDDYRPVLAGGDQIKVAITIEIACGYVIAIGREVIREWRLKGAIT